MLFQTLRKSYEYYFILVIFGISVYKNIINTSLTQKRDFHIFINDAFLYNRSKSFNKDTIAVLFSSHKFIDYLPVTCYSIDKNLNGLSASPEWYRALEAPPQCKWTVYVVLCPVVPNIQTLYFNSPQKISEQVSFQLADSTPRNVVVCMSRMFSFENWQLFITALEIYKHYGADLIVTYLVSLHPLLFKVMEYYEKEGILKMKPGHRYFQPEGLEYDPNTEGEWSNQDASYNSCLYEFKDSANFMLFADWDDILIPAYYDSYQNELDWLKNLFPQASSFIFPRYTVQISASTNSFDISEILKTLELDGTEETGKHIAMPSQINGTWIHAPTRVNKISQVIRLRRNQAKVLHFRNWVYSGDEKNPKFNQTYLFLNMTGIKHSFDQFLQRNNINELLLQMPQKLVYYPLLVDCYDTIKRQLSAYSYHKCPSTPKCHLTQTDVPCLNLEFNFRSVRLSDQFYLHQRVHHNYRESNNGCLM